jgi:predicted nucleotidyltransferase
LFVRSESGLSLLRHGPTVHRRKVRTADKVRRPERVTLFGSQARGDAGPDSDVDLLVVLDFEGPDPVIVVIREWLAKADNDGEESLLNDNRNVRS